VYCKTGELSGVGWTTLRWDDEHFIFYIFHFLANKTFNEHNIDIYHLKRMLQDVLLLEAA